MESTSQIELSPEFMIPVKRVQAAPFEASFVTFFVLWTFIGLVSAYDGYLTVRYQHLLHVLEQNPIGRWIMELDSNLVHDHEYGYVVANRSLARFLGLKFSGTVVGLGLMLAVHRYKASLGLLITSVMAGLQALLALYLSIF